MALSGGYLRSIKLAHCVWTQTQNEPFVYRALPAPKLQPATAGGPMSGTFGLTRNEVIFFGACMFVGLLFLGLLIHDGLLRLGSLSA
jgi:hypothetical protein